LVVVGGWFVFVVFACLWGGVAGCGGVVWWVVVGCVGWECLGCFLACWLVLEFLFCLACFWWLGCSGGAFWAVVVGGYEGFCGGVLVVVGVGFVMLAGVV